MNRCVTSIGVIVSVPVCVCVRACVCVCRDGAVSACCPAADGLLRGAQSVEGVVGEQLQAGSACISVRRPSIDPQREQLCAGQLPLSVLSDPNGAAPSTSKQQKQVRPLMDSCSQDICKKDCGDFFFSLKMTESE